MPVLNPRNVLWPTDFSALSLKCAEHAKAICPESGAQLHVLHVAPVLVPSNAQLAMMTGGDMLTGVADTVTPARQLLKSRFGGRAVKAAVVVGNPWYEICRCAAENNIDLIVISTHGASGLRRLFIGSTAERVVQHAPCPVLVIKSMKIAPLPRRSITSRRAGKSARRSRKTRAAT